VAHGGALTAVQHEKQLEAQTAAAQLSCGSAIAQQCSAKTGRPRWRRGDMAEALALLRRLSVRGVAAVSSPATGVDHNSRFWY
jgi:hypothetical protein